MTRILALCSMLALMAGAEPAAKLDPGLPYQAKKANPVTYDVDFAVVVTAPYHTKVLKVWLPLPQTDPGQEVQEGEITTFPLKVKPKIATEPVFGNKFAYFEFQHPEGAQIIRHTFKVKVWELRWNIDAKKVASVAKWPDGFGPYLKTEKQSVVVNDRVREIARGIVKDRKQPTLAYTMVMGWVNDHMTYDHSNASLQASSEHALKGMRGHCSDYHGLCASLGRAIGFPTRVTYGLNPYPKNSPSHCKLEAFVPPYGWVSFDVSETQKLIADIKKDGKLTARKKEELVKAANDRLNAGFRDNSWFLQTRGTDYDLAPPASKKVAVVRTIYAEGDGVALPEPDPANPKNREFSWMTVQKFTPDRPVSFPFAGWKSLEK